jgi:hypothetical protein
LPLVPGTKVGITEDLTDVSADAAPPDLPSAPRASSCSQRTKIRLDCDQYSLKTGSRAGLTASDQKSAGNIKGKPSKVAGTVRHIPGSLPAQTVVCCPGREPVGKTGTWTADLAAARISRSLRGVRLRIPPTSQSPSSNPRAAVGEGGGTWPERLIKGSRRPSRLEAPLPVYLSSLDLTLAPPAPSRRAAVNSPPKRGNTSLPMPAGCRGPASCFVAHDIPQRTTGPAVLSERPTL